MDQQKQELVEKLKGASNILVTVSSNPSVDQLSACIGMTILLNKLKKHATAVFSGDVPSTIEFLKPEETIEKNTDSLRDFIISLDKSKADKLRYKVEDRVVKIFITPYKTSISQDDLDFSQGDFNVDVVLCLGVNQQQDLDQAITSHGRILHDAVVTSINVQQGSELGTINWTKPAASSLSELVAEICDQLGKDLLDAQVATALLTGIVAETGRFSNEKTSPDTMRLSAQLMSAGANQQLVANELEIDREPAVTPMAEGGEGSAPDAKGEDGTLEINHPSGGKPEGSESEAPDTEAPGPELPEPILPEVDDVKQSGFGDDEFSALVTTPSEPGSSEVSAMPASRIMMQPPALGGRLTANSSVEEDNDLPDLLASQPVNDQPILSHKTLSSAPATTTATPPPSDADEPAALSQYLLSPSEPPPSEPAVPVNVTPPEPVSAQPPPEPVSPPAEPAVSSDTTTPPPAEEPSTDSKPEPVITPVEQIQIDSNGNLKLPGAEDVAPKTLDDLEKAVDSPHVAADEPAAASNSGTTDPSQGLEAARNAVTNAINSLPPSGPPTAKADVAASGYLNVQALPGTDQDNKDAPMTDGTASSPIPPVPDLTEAAAAASPPEPTAPGESVSPAPLDAPVLDEPTDSTDAEKSDAPPPVPPPLPLDDLTKFTNPSPKPN